MNAVVLQHEENEGLGLLEPALREAGFTPVHRFRSVRREDLEAPLLVVLGGSIGVYEAALHPFVNDERSLLAERLARDLPCLGICFGAQLMASAAGAEVFRGKNGFVLGVAPVRWSPAAQEDDAFHGVRNSSPVAHWHRDTFKAVPGAVLLASTDRYTQQAFRLGKSYGLQFHLELTAKALAGWYDVHAKALAEDGVDVAALRLQLPKLAAAEPENQRILQQLCHTLREAVGT